MLPPCAVDGRSRNALYYYYDDDVSFVLLIVVLVVCLFVCFGVVIVWLFWAGREWRVDILWDLFCDKNERTGCVFCFFVFLFLLLFIGTCFVCVVDC